MKKAFKRTLAAVIVVLIGTLLAFWRVLECTEDERAIHRALAEGLSGQITEFAYDPTDPGSWLEGRIRVLARRDLSGSEWQRLVSALEPPVAFSPRPRLACLFEPHHRVDWTDSAGKSRQLFICFHCGQLYLSGVASADFGTHATLRTFIESIGLPLRSEQEYHTP